MLPLVSVCIPTYNGAKYLRECLDSVLAQTFTDFDVLIVDDKSSDTTLDIAQEYASRDSQIKIIANPSNLGLVGNWNRCVELAQGEWIKFVFQDDLIAPNCLEKMLSASRAGTGIISCNRNFIFESDIPEADREYYLSLPSLDKLFPGITEISAQDYCETILNYINRIYLNFVGEPTAVMLHRSVFYRFGFFNSYLIQACDLEFWARVAVHTGINHVPETLATWRVHKGSTTNINQESRNYLKNTLEWLIILQDFAYHPIYQPLRDAASRRQPPINLIQLLADKAYDARRIAEGSQDTKLLREWENLVRLYPLFSSLSQRNLFKRIMLHGIYRWKQFLMFYQFKRFQVTANP
jgi:glycosyltransferase involved in cell wall biosynthesis